jgi:hypothetical protein
MTKKRREVAKKRREVTMCILIYILVGELSWNKHIGIG